MINVILFDLGNVILPVDGWRLAKRLTAFSPLTAEQILTAFNDDPLVHQFETGKMSPDEFFAHIREACRLDKMTFDEFIELFNDIFEEDARVVALIKKLKRNYKLGLVSNTNAIHVQYLQKRYPILSEFDRLLFSNEAGVRKPDPAIYRLALDHFSSKPGDAVFIDDLANNIAGAKEVGLHAIRFQGYEKLTEDLQALGVAV